MAEKVVIVLASLALAMYAFHVEEGFWRWWSTLGWAGFAGLVVVYA